MHYITPFATDKNLGKVYNEAMEVLPEDHVACIRDIDTMFLTPTQPAIIEQYAATYPNALLTCYTNRVSALSIHQLLNGSVSENPNILDHIKIAESMNTAMTVTLIRRPISGFLMVLPKAIWKRFPFPENGQCLGVDTDYSRLLQKNNIPILRMDSIYVFHVYRLKNGTAYKKHLQ